MGFFRCTCVHYLPFTGSMIVCACVFCVFSLCVQECSLFDIVWMSLAGVHVSACVECIVLCSCVHPPMNLSAHVAVLALYGGVWIIWSSGAIKPRAVRQDGSWNDHREAALLFPRQPSAYRGWGDAVAVFAGTRGLASIYYSHAWQHSQWP